MIPRLVRSRTTSFLARALPPLHLPGPPGLRAGGLLTLLSLAACGDSSTVPIPEPPVAPVPTTLELSAEEVLLSFLGASGQVSGRVLDQDGDPMSGQEVRFSMVDEAVATVDDTGLVTAVAEGLTQLVASSGTLTAQALVDVRTGWTSVATGKQHACGLWGHGVAYCWGDDSSGQLGFGSEGGPVGGMDSAVPAPVATDVLFDVLALGDGHSCGLATSGEVLCWGWNAVGQLGTGDVSDRGAPTPVETDGRFVQLAAGAFHNCGITTDAAALCWGGGGGFDDGRDLALGFEPPDACSPPGSYLSDRCSLTPREVGGDLILSQISAGLFHSCAIGTDGRSWCWGWNRGQLGNGEHHPDNPAGTEPGYASPVLVHGALSFERLSAGNAHTCGVTTVGGAWCWGEQGFQTGALGNGDVVGATTPVAVDSDATFSLVGASNMNSIYNQFTCALDDGGSAWCWGANRRGQLGAVSRDSCAVGGGQIPCSLSPVPVDTDLTFTDIATGLEFTCALDTQERTWCWGANDRGQLGNGGGVDRGTPVRVSDPPLPEQPEAGTTAG